jgi:hypothetical protein
VDMGKAPGVTIQTYAEPTRNSERPSTTLRPD